MSIDPPSLKSEEDFRRAEIDIKYRELYLKEKENKKGWSYYLGNPFLVGVALAVVGILGNAYVQNLKRESDLIVEAIKGGDPDLARRNLLFLDALSLVNVDEDKVRKFEPYLPVGQRNRFAFNFGNLVFFTEEGEGGHVRVEGTVYNFGTSPGVLSSQIQCLVTNLDSLKTNEVRVAIMDFGKQIYLHRESQIDFVATLDSDSPVVYKSRKQAISGWSIDGVPVQQYSCQYRYADANTDLGFGYTIPSLPLAQFYSGFLQEAKRSTKTN